MSFAVFRKYEKSLLAVAVVFTVVVFVFFPSMGSMSDVLRGSGDDADLQGSFTVATTGEVHDVSLVDFRRTYRDRARLSGARSNDLTDAEVWDHIMLLEDARGAGLKVTDGELALALQQIFGEGNFTAERYTLLWKAQLQFPTARAFEHAYRESLLVQRWVEVLLSDARVVDAEAVFQRWKIDNELFDLDVVVFADADPESVEDPGDEVLKAWYDEMPAYLRERRFVDPARYDLALAWIPLDAAVETLPAARVAELKAVEEGEIEARFNMLKPTRYPDLEAADEAISETLRSELVVIGLATAAHREWVALGEKPIEGPVEEGVEPPPRTAQEFVDFMASWGLIADDPSDFLSPDDLADLPEVGSPNLGNRLLNTRPGDSRYYRPYGDETRAVVLFVEDVEPETPLGFTEARDQVLDAWREDPAQVAAAANEFRDELRARARAVEEAAEVLSEFETLAAEAAAARIAASEEELDEDAQEAIRAEELELVSYDIESRLSPYEHRAWDELVQAALADGSASQRVAFEAVPRSWRLKNSGPEIDRTTLDYYVRSNGRVFELAEDALSDVLRHITGDQSVVVRVTARAFPEMSAMLADTEGMEQARQALAGSMAAEFQLTLLPERLAAPRSDSNPWGHGLRLIQVAAPEDEGADPGDEEDPASTSG